MISDDFSSDGLESCWKVLSIKNNFSFLFHLITFFFSFFFDKLGI